MGSASGEHYENKLKRKSITSTDSSDDDDDDEDDDDEIGNETSSDTSSNTAPIKKIKHSHEIQFKSGNDHRNSTHQQQPPLLSTTSYGGGMSRGNSLGIMNMDSSSDESTKSSSQVLSDSKHEYPSYSGTSMLIMQKMGFKPDQGLGKTGQGRIEPIEASEQKGRRGLGLRLDGLDAAAVKFDPTMEHVQLRENAEWLHSSTDNLDDLSRDELEAWLVVGHTKMTLDDESKFCDPKILADVLGSKTIFDNLGAEDMRRARTRSNPFETIRGGIFINRAAVKMANMDSMFDFMFTKPVDEHGGPLVRDDDLMYFADVCAGPGGFSEYILWRNGWQAKGFGFTLKKENDFKLHEFFAGHPETFDAYYGINEDGNVFDPANIESFAKYVLSQTQDRGVHFMMADGGFSVEGQENIQEILSKQLYLSQCIVALSIVREKGHFVVKMFDLFTPFSVGLIYLMYKCFQQICIFKPNTSRPANSERYLVCKWKKSNTDTIYRHMFEINRVMWENPNSDTDFLELVPFNVLTADEKFFNYIVESNNTIGRNQIAGLLKIAAFCKDVTLKETRQVQIRTDCLKIWKLPADMRKAPPIKSNAQLFQELLGSWHAEKQFLSDPEKMLKRPEKLGDIFRDITDWYFVALELTENTMTAYRTFFMSKGGRNVYRYKANGSWEDLRDTISVELTPNTLIFGEIAKELTGQGKSQTVVNALHIIDGIILGGIDIRNLPLRKRLKMCEKFATALNKPNKVITNRDGTVKTFIAPITCKKLFALRDFRSFFDRLQHYELKSRVLRYGLPVRNVHGPDRFFVPRGLMFFNEMKPNLQKAFSRSQQKIYFIDHSNGKTFFEDLLPDPNVIYASFRTTFCSRRIWTWETETQVKEDDPTTSRMENILYRYDLDVFIASKQNVNLS